MRQYIRPADNRLVESIELNKQASDRIFPISVQLKPKWLGDFLHKQKGSDIIKHKAFFNFKSSHDQFISDYITDEKLVDEYGDLIYPDYMKDPLYGKNYEFENKDYVNIGNKIRDWVSIIYSNLSDFKLTPFPISGVSKTIVDFFIKKKYPCYYGYAFYDETEDNGFATWYLINSIPGDPEREVYSEAGFFFVNEQCNLNSKASVQLYDSDRLWEHVTGDYNNYIYETVSPVQTIPRYTSIKIDEASKVYRLNEKEEYTYVQAESFDEPLIFFNQTFNSDWYRWICRDYYPTSINDESARVGECFFDKINLKGIRYPSAARFTRNSSLDSVSERQGGVVFKSNLRYQNEPDDQSSLLYNVASSMLYREDFPSNDPGDPPEPNKHFVIKHYWMSDPGSDLIVDGMDVTGEANRRVTSTCLTEPYHTTDLMNDGEVIDYVFVNESGRTPYIWSQDNMYLRLRTSYILYKQIRDSILNPEINDDVIQTITFFETPNSNLPDVPGDNYATFKGNISGLDNYRRDHDVVDLVGGPVGTGKYYEFTIPTSDTRYSDGKMKVLGVSQFDWIDFISDDEPVVKTGMKIYVGNYSPENCRSNTGGEIPNEEVEFIDLSLYTEQTFDTPGDYTLEDGEKLYPMMKLPRMQGFIKILEIFNNEKSFTPTKSNAYIDFFVKIETPFCAGMNDLRTQPDNVTSDDKFKWKKTQIYKTKGYIRAGSHKVIDGRKEQYNDRYIPINSEFVTDYIILNNINAVTPRLLSSDNGKFFEYPPYSVWWRNLESWPNIRRPISNAYWDHGSVNASIKAPFNTEEEDPTELIRSLYDVKIMFYINNQKWKFGDKYLSYMRREHPQFIYEMDVNTLLNDYTPDQFKNYGIPDNKQYYFATNKGNAEISNVSEDPSTYYYRDSSDYFGSTPADSLADMKSDLKLEVWNDSTKKWNKIIDTSNSSSKKTSLPLIENLYILSDSPQSPHEVPITYPYFRKVTLGYFNDNGLQLVMPQEGLDLNGSQNLVLYNSKIDKAYHIAWVESDNYPPFGISGDNVLKIVVEDDEDLTLLASESGSVLTPPPDSSDVPVLSITTAEQLKSGISDYKITSRYSRASVFETLSLNVNQGSVNSDGKVYIRFTLERDATYRMGDNNIQYNGSALSNISGSTETERTYSNFPWGDGTTFDAIFDYEKIEIQEIIRYLKAHFFSLNNVY